MHGQVSRQTQRQNVPFFRQLNKAFGDNSVATRFVFSRCTVCQPNIGKECVSDVEREVERACVIYCQQQDTYHARKSKVEVR